MPECDDPVNPTYDLPWVHHSLPGTIDTDGIFTPEQCLRYISVKQNNTLLPPQVNGANDTCPAEWFTKDEESCNSFVFDNYEKTIVQEVRMKIINELFALDYIMF